MLTVSLNIACIANTCIAKVRRLVAKLFIMNLILATAHLCLPMNSVDLGFWPCRSRRRWSTRSWLSRPCAAWCWLRRCLLTCGGEMGSHWSARYAILYITV